MHRAFDPNRDRYIDLLIKILTNTIYEDVSTSPYLPTAFDPIARASGRDWPQIAHTMVGTARLRNVADLVNRTLDCRAAQTHKHESEPGHLPLVRCRSKVSQHYRGNQNQNIGYDNGKLSERTKPDRVNEQRQAR